MEKIYDLIIVGSGPAGMTAAIYAARNNLDVMIVEGLAPGGQMINTNSIENYPGFSNIDGASLAYSMHEQVVKLNVEYQFGMVTKIIKNDNFVITINNQDYFSKTVIIATGAKNRKLHVPGEEALIGRGVSFCAICDGHFYKGKKVAVVGGGNASLEESLYLATVASDVYLIHRRNEFRAEESIVERVKNTGNIHLVLNSQVIKFNGQNKLESLDIINNETKSVTNLEVEGCFEFVGMLPSSELVKEFNCVDEAGYILVDENFETQVKGLYACGDVVKKKIRQIVTACNDGAIASMHITKVIK